MHVTPSLVKERLISNLEGVLSHLLPNGKIRGHEFRVGSVLGEAGKNNGGSLSVELNGNDRGCWQDFAFGNDPDNRGDIMKLWCRVRGHSFKEAFPEMKRFAGFTQIDIPRKKPKPIVAKIGIEKLSPEVHTYLNERGITDDTLRLYKIRSHLRRVNMRDENSEVRNDFVMFPFLDTEGDAVMIKSTWIHLLEGRKNIWTSKPYYTLWGWWLVDDDCREIAIIEGEYDAMSVHQLGPKTEDGSTIPCLSLPSGTSNMDWIGNDWERLQMFERIWLIFDDDDPHPKTGLVAGEEGARECSRRLGASRCRRVPIPGGFKDPNNLLTSGDDRFLEWSSWVDHAYSFDPPTIASADEYRMEALARLARQKKLGEENNFIWKKIPFQFRNGECTVVSGYPGGGKSAWIYQTHVNEMIIGEKFFMCSFEIEPDDMILQTACILFGHEPDDKQLNQAIDWMVGKLYFYRVDTTKKIELMEILADLDYAVQRFGCTRLVIDSLHFIARKEDYELQDKVALETTKFAKSRDVHVALVAHSIIKKGEEIIPGISMVEGSGGITKPIDNGITIWRNSKKSDAILKAEEQEDEEKLKKAHEMHDGVMKFWKHRLTGRYPQVKMWFDPDGKSFRLKRDDEVYAPFAEPVADEEKELF